MILCFSGTHLPEAQSAKSMVVIAENTHFPDIASTQLESDPYIM